MLTIPSQYTSLKYIRPTSWKEVFDTWRELEAWQKSWKQHWTERGFDTWDEWRKAYIEPYQPTNLSWELYEITEPLKDAPYFYGTPTKGWIEKAYAGETTLQLKELAQHPILKDNEKINDIKRNFPAETMLTGVVYDNKIVLLEGMHRANALANWSSGSSFTGKVTIALANWSKPLLRIGGNYKDK